MIKITPKAKEYIKKFNTDNSTHLRVACKSGGCAGLKYDLSYTNEVSKVDKEYVVEDIKIVMDFKSRMYVENITIDYTEGLSGKGFEFSNPQAKSGCGCGVSFGV